MSLGKCEVCGRKAMRNSIVCSDECQEVRLKRHRILDKYTPTHGCDNCWGDLHQGCTNECKAEFKLMGELSQDLWSLIRLVVASLTKPQPQEDLSKGKDKE